MKTHLLAVMALALIGGAAFAQDVTSTSGSASDATVTTGSQSSSVSNPSQSTNVSNDSFGNGASSSQSHSSAVSSTQSAATAYGNSSSNRNYSTSAGGSASSTLSGGNSTAAGGSSDASGNTTNVTVNTDPSGSSGSSDPVIHYSGGYTVRNTPENIPPAISGGNPCTVGVSGGVSLPGIGIAGGGTWADKACERRQEAALLFNMGQAGVATELMCQDSNVRDAMKIAGKPCIEDVAAIVPAVQPVPTAQLAPAPAVVAPAPVVVAPVATPAPAPAPVADRPEWCNRARPTTDADREYVSHMCGSV